MPLNKQTITTQQIWQALEAVKDPEIPVVSVVAMGIVRDVTIQPEGEVHVQMTPTFSGCPALHVMREDITQCLQQLGFDKIEVETVLYPPWTTEWITEAAREKLRQFGLAPPPRHTGDAINVAFFDVAECPRCGSKNTVLKNSFGPTLCRMIWYCNQCEDAFEQFKPL